MQPYSDYEIAQRRIAERRANKDRFQFLLAAFGLLILITLVSGQSASCTVPLGIITALFAFSYGLELYYTNPIHAPSDREIEQEMAWLFGDDWQEQANTQAYALAQDRIRKRRTSKWGFLGHTVLFVPINGFLALWALDNFVFAIIALVWLGLFITHAISAFPRKRWLARREMKYGQTLQSELSRLQATTPKQKEKLKRGKYYEVGDDGELVEVEDEIMRLEDKPKREMGNQ